MKNLQSFDEFLNEEKVNESNFSTIADLLKNNGWKSKQLGLYTKDNYEATILKNGIRLITLNPKTLKQIIGTEIIEIDDLKSKLAELNK